MSVVPPNAVLIERLLERMIPEPNSGCWIFLGGLTAAGYGQIGGQIGGRRWHRYAHRVSYEHFNGPIPAGLEPDHKCRVRCCFNPRHLEAVTRTVNIRRGTCPAVQRARHAARSQCKWGHPYTAETMVVRDGYRACRVCERERQHRHRHRSG